MAVVASKFRQKTNDRAQLGYAANRQQFMICTQQVNVSATTEKEGKREGGGEQHHELFAACLSGVGPRPTLLVAGKYTICRAGVKEEAEVCKYVHPHCCGGGGGGGGLGGRGARESGLEERDEVGEAPHETLRVGLGPRAANPILGVVADAVFVAGGGR